MTTTILDTDPLNEDNGTPSWQAWRDHMDVFWAADATASSYRGSLDTAALHAMTTANTAIRFELDDCEEPRDE